MGALPVAVPGLRYGSSPLPAAPRIARQRRTAVHISGFSLLGSCSEFGFGSEFRFAVQGSGFQVPASRFRVPGSGFESEVAENHPDADELRTQNSEP